ncbi:glycosyltransferase family 87 protein [Dongia rigui]|uniref:Glycosyltransferase family 87 protein n=1 Tax=Dongia rigui TaxID=940149 RepID=A0ABU5E081_9PROT|nr:glycosyltransferase family 87 protein [Dongia rigui]MDY0872298.1 glycosyltransferase family 87 protein [Dongia rigui]
MKRVIAALRKAGAPAIGLWVLALVIGPILSLVYARTIDDVVFSEHRDFGVFWTASTLLWRGEVLQLFDPAAFKAALVQVMGPDFPYLSFPYPPHSLFVLAPLSLLPYLPSLALWLTFTFGAMALALWRGLAQRWVMLPGLLLCPASAVNMAGGQNGFLSAALLGAGLLCLERRQILAGLCIGFLSYKPQLGLLLPLLLIAGGYWRAFMAACVTVVVLVLLSALAFGPEAWLLYLTKSGPYQAEIAQHWTGRFQFMSPTYFMAGRLLGLPLALAWVLQITASILAAAGAIWAVRQPIPHALKAAIAMVAVFLVSPYALTYDLTIVSAAILIAMSVFAPTWWEYAACLIVWLLPAFTLPSDMPIGPLLISILFMVLLRRAFLLRTAALVAA